MSDSQQPTLTFQSKFAARKAQEDQAFKGLYSGSFQNRDGRVSGDIAYGQPNESNQPSLTQDGTWDRQRLTATQNVVQNKWVSPNIEPRQGLATQESAQAYQMNNSAYAGQRLVGSSSNSGLSHNKVGFEVQGRDYRATMQVPASQSLNYEDKDRYLARVGATAHAPKDGAGSMRGKSSDAVDSVRHAYRYGHEALNQSTSQGGFSNQRLNGNATYNMHNYDRDHRGYQEASRNVQGRNEFGLEHPGSHEQHASASVGKPSLGAYGYSAGPAATRKLDYVIETRTAPFEVQTKYNRNSTPQTIEQPQYSRDNRVSDNFGDYRAKDCEPKVDQNYEEVVDGYTEYFSQGCDYNGQLGHGQDPSQHDRNRHVNLPKSLSFDILIRRVACGGSHTLILSKQGELFSIGSNEYGQLGLNDRQLSFTTAPLLVQEVQSKALQVQQIISGQNHSLILAQNGQIYSWGSNIYGQCGLGKSSSGQNSPTFLQGDSDMNRIYLPQRVRSELYSSDGVKDVLAGENFSGWLTSGGDVFTFGDNAEGQLGVGSSQGSFKEPRRVACDEKIAQASLGYQHMLLLTYSGRVLGAGRNREHQLGLGGHHGDQEQGSSVPVRIDSIRDVEVLKVVAGGFSAALIQNAYDRQLLVWGQGDFGVYEKPQKLYMDGLDFVDIQIGKFSTNNPFAVAIEKNGKVYSWGSNTLGQLGHGDQRVRKLPTQIQSLKRKTITQMSVGHNFVVMLGRDVSQEEQQKKKLKRKLQKEAKERERQRNKAKHVTQDENKRPMGETPAADNLQSKGREYERRDSNQPATPKLPGESARQSLGLGSTDRVQDSNGRSRPKSANNHAVRGIIEEMEKISNKGQGLLERVQILKQAKSNEMRSGRSPYPRDNEQMPSRRDRSAHVEDSRGMQTKHGLGPAKSASFGEAPTDHEDPKERQPYDYRNTTYYTPKASYVEQQTATSNNHVKFADQREKDTQGRSVPEHQDAQGRNPQGGYQPLAIESSLNKNYREEIEELRQQLLKAKDNSKLYNEIDELKHQLRSSNQEIQQLREDLKKAEACRDQENAKSNNFNQEQNRRCQEMEERLYQKDRELNDLRIEIGEQRTSYHDAKQTMIDQENKIKQVEQSYDQLKATFESKITELDHEKIELGKELDDAAHKNQQLMTIVKQKQQELHETQKIANQAKTMKKQLSKLEEIIDDLQSKNKELNELLNKKMIERAENYKKEVVEFLNKPKAYEVEMSKEIRRTTERSEINSQYKKLGEEVDREQAMTYVHGQQQDGEKYAVERQSYNEKSFQEYRKDQTFLSEYGKNLGVNQSIQLPARRDNLISSQAHNSEEKRRSKNEYIPVENSRDQREQKTLDYENGEGIKATRSVPRYSKIEKLSSSQIYPNDRRDTALDRPRDRYDQTVGRGDDLKTEYQRHTYALGQSIEGLAHQERDQGRNRSDIRQMDRDHLRSRNSQEDYNRAPTGASNSLRERNYLDQVRPSEKVNPRDHPDDLDENRYARGQSSTAPAARERVEGDNSRTRFDPDGSLGRPPLTGQRVSDKDREYSADRRHQRVRSGHQPAHSSSRIDTKKQVVISQTLNDSHHNSRIGNDEAAGVKSAQGMSNPRSHSDRRYSEERVNYQNNPVSSQRAGSTNQSREREGISYRSREQAQKLGIPENKMTGRNDTTHSKNTRKEYVDITDHGSEGSYMLKKVHRIDLAQDDQEDIQKQIQQKLQRIQKIFQGQQERQGNDNAISIKDQVTSGTRLSRLNNDDNASFNDRASQHAKDKGTGVDVNSFLERPMKGSKTPVSNNHNSSLVDLNANDAGTFHRIQSNPTAIMKSEDQKKLSTGYDDHHGSGHQRRKSLSHHLSTNGRELEGGSRGDDKGSYKRAETGEFGQQHCRPGEMRYSQDDQQDIRD